MTDNNFDDFFKHHYKVGVFGTTHSKPEFSHNGKHPVVKFGGTVAEYADKYAILTFCNTVRDLGGADIIQELLPGVKSEANSCLIANNLNFNCKVEPIERINKGGLNMDWIMIIEGNDDLIFTLAHKLDLEIKTKTINFLSRDTNVIQRGVILPKLIGNAAAAFDLGAFSELETTNA